jgi:hypothetical protein
LERAQHRWIGYDTRVACQQRWVEMYWQRSNKPLILQRRNSLAKMVPDCVISIAWTHSIDATTCQVGKSEYA